MIEFGFPFQAIDLFMSSCMIFVFLSLIEYAFVNVMMGDISDGNENEKNLYIHISKFYNMSIKLLKVIDVFFIYNSGKKGQNWPFKEYHRHSKFEFASWRWLFAS